MEFLRSVFGKRQIILAITGFVSFIFFVTLAIVISVVSSKQKTQAIAGLWTKDNSFAQVSAYISELSEFEESNMKKVEGYLENRLNSDSITAKNENARRVVLAYSGQGEAELSSGKSTVTVKCYGVGGDFFIFHPFDIVSGSYFDGNDLMNDTVVLDTTTAWNLFGSTNVVGQIITVGNRQHVIVGVVEKETGKLNDLAGNDVPTVFLSMNSLKNHGTFTYLSTVEALLPNPITGYAKDILSTSLGLDENRYEVVQNTDRFSWGNLVNNAKNFGTRGMNKKGLVYPYWENVARGVEDMLTPVCIAAIVFLTYPCLLLLALVIRMYRKRTIHKKDIFDFLVRSWENYRQKRRKKIEDGEYEDLEYF